LEDSSASKATGKDKIAAAKEEPLAEGWEIVGLRKKERKDVKKKEKEEEEKIKKVEQDKKSAEEGSDKKNSGKQGGKKGEHREKREGDRERGPKGSNPRFGDRKNRRDHGKKDEKVPASPLVSEKTKRREEIKINGIVFSKFKDDEEEDEDWELLSEIIENGSSGSDDIAPLRTAHLELRYYAPAKDTPSPSPKKTTPWCFSRC